MLKLYSKHPMILPSSLVPMSTRNFIQVAHKPPVRLTYPLPSRACDRRWPGRWFAASHEVAPSNPHRSPSLNGPVPLESSLALLPFSSVTRRTPFVTWKGRISNKTKLVIGVNGQSWRYKLKSYIHTIYIEHKTYIYIYRYRSHIVYYMMPSEPK